ncbi:MAG: NAD(P)-binding protein, partial [Pseudomonadota bacterium]|nr:NAD(P)-binding protein [Pseudomonadota bacterium]
IQASLDLVNSGTKVYLVEEDISIGGVMAQLDKTFPTNDCSACILSPKLVEVGRHPNVEILTRHEVKTVTGQPGHFHVTLERQPRFVDLDKCTGCGECVNVCPVSLTSDFNENLDQRQAIYRKFPQAIPSAFAIDKAGTAPCKAACPAHISVQGYVALIAQGKYREALELIKRDNPFPVVCGRVCNHPCESACMRQEVDDPVAIMYLKRFVADLDLNEETRFIPEIKESKDKKIAVVGAGPAGLTAAYYLAVEGYQVTVFEALPVAGGMLAVGIPNYRLPQDLLAAEIDIIKSLGVEIKLNTVIGKDISISDLQRDYDALFVGVGSHQGSKLGVDGEALDGNIQGIDFLRRVNLGEKLCLGKRVAVIGGGNVAMDAVRTALRTGSEEAFVLYRRTREEMPAADEEIKEALHEGIKMEFLAAPVRIIGDKDKGKKGKVVGIECVRMELGEADESGRRRPVPTEGSEFILDVDAVVPAIGQTSDLSAFTEIDGISLSRWHTIDVDELTFAATDCGIFAGGDAVSGPATVIEAINAGKEAAISINRYLAGQDLKAGRKQKQDWQNNIALPTNYEKLKKETRIRPAELDPETRKTNFDEVVLAYSEEQARKEAEKCLSCGICSECYQCVDVCIANAIDHDMCAGEEAISVGAIIAAPGGEIFDAKLKGEYGFGIYENVVTSIQFERILSASGPFFGHVQRISDAREPKKIAFIQCVGSRDAACGNSWCS